MSDGIEETKAAVMRQSEWLLQIMRCSLSLSLSTMSMQQTEAETNFREIKFPTTQKSGTGNSKKERKVQGDKKDEEKDRRGNVD